MFFLPKSFPHIVYHPFQVMNNINGNTTKKILKKGGPFG
jgi:hypothetical protein